MRLAPGTDRGLRGAAPFHDLPAGLLAAGPAPGPMTHQFEALVFKERSGYRVVIPAVGEVLARDRGEVEARTREFLLRHVRAAFPERQPTETPWARDTLRFSLELRRVAAAGTPAGPERRRGSRRAAPTPSARDAPRGT